MGNLKRNFLITFVSLYLTVPSVAYSNSYYAASCSLQDVQTAVVAASNGDTVVVPSGTCTWNSTLSISSSKAIKLLGTMTTIKRIDLGVGKALLAVSTNPTQTTQITRFNFLDESKTDQGESGAVFISISGSPNNAKFRIDSNTFSAVGSGCNTSTVGANLRQFIHVYGQQYGVIDNNTFNFATASEVIHNRGYGPTNEAGWLDDVTPGSGDALYVESNKFWNTCTLNIDGTIYAGANSAVQAYYGARTVFRYNTIQMAKFDNHGTPGMIGGRWWEIYDNTWEGVANGGLASITEMRGGSGVIFNNKVISNGAKVIGPNKFYEEDTGTYPLPYQVGRGKKIGGIFTADPAYVWNNGSYYVNGDSYVQEGRDYYLSAKLNYVPYPYPHPLTLIQLKQPNFPAIIIQ